MIKILQINVDANNGSNGAIARNIGTIVMRAGWQSYIAYGRNVVPGDSIQIKIGNKLDVIWHVIESRIFDNHGLASRLVTKRFISKIKRIQPDIIHLHNIHGYFINYKYLFEYLEKSKIPVVWTLHDCWSFTGHCAHFVSKGCFKWETQCISCPLKNNYPKSIIFDNSRKNYQYKKKLFNSLKSLTIVPVSNWLGNFVERSFLKHNKIQVIHNGIDLEVFQPLNITKASLGLNSHKIVVLGVSNVWIKSKGLLEFINLSKDDRLQVVMIGVDENILKLLPNNIIAIKRTQNQQQLSEYYSTADVFVNPTYADTFPTVNLEALACGTPVVTYNTGGSPEALDKDTGIVVDQGDYNALLNAIIEIASESAEKNIVRRKKCRERAVRYFDRNDRFMEYFELYKRLISNDKL